MEGVESLLKRKEISLRDHGRHSKGRFNIAIMRVTPSTAPQMEVTGGQRNIPMRKRTLPSVHPLIPPFHLRGGHPIHLSCSGILTGSPFDTGEARVSSKPPRPTPPKGVPKEDGCKKGERGPSPIEHPQSIPPLQGIIQRKLPHRGHDQGQPPLLSKAQQVSPVT